jgi:hypothetical protein
MALTGGGAASTKFAPKDNTNTARTVMNKQLLIF